MEKYLKKSCKNNKSKISAPTWHEESQLPDGSYSISGIQYYFEYILKRHREKIVNPSIRIYIYAKVKIKTRYYLELLTLETMKLFGST